jgi:hypothetical protein
MRCGNAGTRGAAGKILPADDIYPAFQGEASTTFNAGSIKRNSSG